MDDNVMLIDLGKYTSNIFKELVYSCDKVRIDIWQIKKIDKIFRVYNIPIDEHIIAYCKSLVPLTPLEMDGLFFTNKAVYFKNNNGNRRLLYSDLCTVFLTQADSKARVLVHTVNTTEYIVECTIFKENLTGQEVLKILISIQEELCKLDDFAKSKRISVAKSICEQAKVELAHNNLTEKTDALLYEITDIYEEATIIKAEQIFREFDIDKYFSFVKRSSNISTETKQKLLEIPQSFFDSYIKILADINTSHNEEDLAKQIKKINDISDIKIRRKYKLLYGYLLARTLRKNEALRVANYIKNDEPEKANQLIVYAYKIEYLCMYNVLLQIKNNDVNVSTIRNFCDCVGLDVLHYLLIFEKNDDIINFLQKKVDVEATSDNEILGYDILAVGKNLRKDVIFDLIKYTNKESIKFTSKLAEKETELKKKRNQIKIAEGILFGYEALLNSQRRSNADSDLICDAECKLEEATCSLEEMRQELKSIQEECNHYFRLMNDWVECKIQEAMQKLEFFREKANVFEQYIFRLYFENDFLEKILMSIKNNDNIRLYHYNGFTFIAPEIAYLSQVDLDNCKPNFFSKDTFKKDEHNTTWFSTNAYNDTDILKSEYRALVKKYHPDICKLNNAKEIFQEINSQYQKILDEKK